MVQQSGLATRSQRRVSELASAAAGRGRSRVVFASRCDDVYETKAAIKPRAPLLAVTVPA
jgi:hypothetical protein